MVVLINTQLSTCEDPLQICEVFTLCGGKLYNTDRWEKSHHNNKTGRECRADVRGLARLPQKAAEVLEGYFSDWGLPPEKYGT